MGNHGRVSSAENEEAIRIIRMVMLLYRVGIPVPITMAYGGDVYTTYSEELSCLAFKLVDEYG